MRIPFDKKNLAAVYCKASKKIYIFILRQFPISMKELEELQRIIFNARLRKEIVIKDVRCKSQIDYIRDGVNKGFIYLELELKNEPFLNGSLKIKSVDSISVYFKTT